MSDPTKWEPGDYLIVAATLFILTIIILTVIGNLQ